MYEVTLSTTDDMCVEVNARLAAMATFLRELEDDPAAGSFLRRFVTQIGDLIACGLDGLDYTPRHLRSLLMALAELRESVEVLPQDSAPDPIVWQRVQHRHSVCRKTFEKFADALPSCGISKHVTTDRPLVATA